MEAEALVSLVIFTGVVGVYRLGRGGAAVADVLPGQEPVSEEASGQGVCESAPAPSRPVVLLQRGALTLEESFIGLLHAPRPLGHRVAGRVIFVRSFVPQMARTHAGQAVRCEMRFRVMPWLVASLESPASFRSTEKPPQL